MFSGFAHALGQRAQTQQLMVRFVEIGVNGRLVANEGRGGRQYRVAPSGCTSVMLPLPTGKNDLSVVKVLVSDTSVLIYLEHGSLVEPAFYLPFEFTVPDLLYERELKPHGGADFVRLGLRVKEFDGSAVTVALGYRRKRRSLSLPDSFAFALAKTNAWTLLSRPGIARTGRTRSSHVPRGPVAARPQIRAPNHRPERVVRRPRKDFQSSAMPATANLFFHRE